MRVRSAVLALLFELFAVSCVQRPEPPAGRSEVHGLGGAGEPTKEARETLPIAEDLDAAPSQEPVGESADGIITARGSPCRAACWAAAALGCGVVGVACANVSVITIGGATIPCAWAAVAACTAGTAGASLCSDACPP